MSDHDDILRKLPAYAAGLLSDDASAEVQSHLATCPGCLEVASALAVDAPGPGVDRAHIPSGVLARWPRASRELRGLERELVANHLEGCQECRGALEVLGFAPTLAEGAPLATHRSDRTRPREWLLGGWAALATAAAVTLAFAPQWFGRTPAGNLTVPPARSPEHEPQAPPALAQPSAPSPRDRELLSAPTLVVLADHARGAPAETTQVQLRGAATWLVKTPLLSVPAERITVSLRNAEGQTLYRASLRGADVVEGGVLLDAGDLPAGTLQLFLEWTTPNGDTRSRDYAIRIVP